MKLETGKESQASFVATSFTLSGSKEGGRKFSAPLPQPSIVWLLLLQHLTVIIQIEVGSRLTKIKTANSKIIFTQLATLQRQSQPKVVFGEKGSSHNIATTTSVV